MLTEDNSPVLPYVDDDNDPNDAGLHHSATGTEEESMEAVDEDASLSRERNTFSADLDEFYLFQ